jgi:hypothetical protein
VCGSQASVEEVDYPVEGLIGVTGPLEAARGLQDGESVQGAAHGADGVVHLGVGDATSAEHGGDGADDTGAGGQQRVGRAGEPGADGGGIPARAGGDVGPERGDQDGQRVEPGPALDRVADRIAETSMWLMVRLNRAMADRDDDVSAMRGPAYFGS